MSPSQNPDFWRSKGGPPTPPNAPKPATPASKPGGKSSSDESSKKDGKSDGTADISGAPVDAPKVSGGQPPAPKSKLAASGAGDPTASKKDSKPLEVPPAAGSAAGGPAAAAGNAGGPVKAGERENKIVSDIGRDGTEFLNKKIDSIGSNRPDKLDAPDRQAPSTSLGRDAEMGKEAIKGAASGAAKGAAKGAMTGGLQGAAAGAIKDGALNAAERINKSEARQRADQGRGKSYKDSLIDNASSNASLAKSRGEMSSRFGAPTDAPSSGNKATDLTPEQVASLTKAATTVASRVTTRAVQVAGISMVVIIGLFLTMLSAITGAIAPVAASSAAYSASSATCEAPAANDTSGSASPGNKGSENGLKPAAVKTMRHVNAQWGGKISDIGGVRNDAGAQDHATGNAIDVMIPDYSSAAGKALGTEIANNLQKNADKLGISYLIWDGKFWTNSGGTSWTYSGDGKTYGVLDWAPYVTRASASDDTQMHRDHVHVSTKDNPGEPLESSKTVTVSSVTPYSDASNSTQAIQRTSVVSRVPAVDSPSAGGESPASLGLNTDEQVANAKTIIGMAKTVGFNEKGAILGITVALVESTLINVNHGDAAGPDSTGLFQQRDHWGAREDRMNPAYAAQAFFLGVGTVPGLKSLPGWESMPTHEAAQAVQRSAYSDGSNYKAKVDLATNIVNKLYASTPPTPAVKAGAVGQPTGTVNTETSKDCTTTTVAGPSSTQAGDTYPAKNESYCRSDACYAVQKADSVGGAGYRGECVDWAAWKIIERTGTYGTHLVASMGNGGDWGAGASAKGIPVDMNPVAGDAIFWLPGTGGSGSAGHIGTVQKVNGDGTIVIEEYNYGTVPGGGDTPETGGGRYHTRVIKASDASGYIHFFDPAKSDEENKANLIAKGVLYAGKGTWPRINA